MFKPKYIVTIVSILILIQHLVIADQTESKDSVKPCSIAVKCSNEPQLAWATDGKNCMVFQNSCHLMNQNCQRANDSEKILRAVDHDECLKYCRRGCTREFNPICTARNEKYQTFQNPCLWSEKMCSSGEPYVFAFRGHCEPSA